jgi:hypothetical protein
LLNAAPVAESVGRAKAPIVLDSEMTVKPLALSAVAAGFLIAASLAVTAAVPNTGSVQGQVTVAVPRGTALSDDASSQKEKIPYRDYPLVVRSSDGKTEIAQVSLDEEGKFQIDLPAGDYLLDMKHRRKGLRVMARPFKVVVGQTVRVNFEISQGLEVM